MTGMPMSENDWLRKIEGDLHSQSAGPAVTEAEATLRELANIFLESSAVAGESEANRAEEIVTKLGSRQQPYGVEARYRALVEQIPAVVFMAYLDQGIGEAYVSPQIEAALGFTQAEWLEDPVRWYDHIYPDDKQRWSTEAAEMFLSGKPLKSAYRVLARDGRVLWFHCEAEMIRSEDVGPGV